MRFLPNLLRYPPPFFFDTLFQIFVDVRPLSLTERKEFSLALQPDLYADGVLFSGSLLRTIVVPEPALRLLLNWTDVWWTAGHFVAVREAVRFFAVVDWFAGTALNASVQVNLPANATTIASAQIGRVGTNLIGDFAAVNISNILNNR